MPNLRRGMMAAAGVSKGEVTEEGSFFGAGAGGTFYTSSFGQRGGSPTSTMSVTVDSSTNWTQLSACYASSAGVKSDNTFWTWGRSLGGQSDRDAVALSDSTSVPTQVGSLTDWDFHAGGDDFRLAVKTDGTLWSFGYNTSGSLGDGTVIKRSSPVQIGSLTTWASCTGGVNQSYAIKTDGTLWAFGSGSGGKLGLGSVTNYSSPVQVGSLTNWTFVPSNYGGFAVATKTDNTLWSWGIGTHGRGGRGDTVAVSSPVQVGSLTDWGNSFGKIATGGGQMLAVKTDGTLWGVGYNENGELGQGNVNNYSSPVQIGSATDWVIVGCGTNSSYAINDSGQLWGWGRNTYSGVGVIGDGTTTNRSSPVQIGTAQSWGGVDGGHSHTIGFRTA